MCTLDTSFLLEIENFAWLSKWSTFKSVVTCCEYWKGWYGFNSKYIDILLNREFRIYHCISLNKKNVFVHHFWVQGYCVGLVSCINSDFFTSHVSVIFIMVKKPIIVILSKESPSLSPIYVYIPKVWCGKKNLQLIFS